MSIRKGDVIISTTRAGIGAIANFNKSELCVGSTGFAVIRDIIGVSKEYLHSLLRSPLCLRQMERRSSGENYPAITQEELGKIVIPIPPVEIQQRIVDHINNIRQQAQTLRAETQREFAEAKAEIERMLLE